jgi:hypothetical protein
MQLQTIVKGADHCKMRLSRIMHVEANLLDNISNIWPSKSQILKGTNKALVVGRIRNMVAFRGYFGTSINWSGARLAICHPRTVKNLKHVLAL